jgi:hypothetical protein
MPKIRRRHLPEPLFYHLCDRIEQRQISRDQLVLMVEWLDSQPIVPTGKCYKKFPKMTVCGEGELIKTFRHVGQLPLGEEV